MSLSYFNLTAVLFAASAYASNIISSDAVLLRSADVLNRPYADVIMTDVLSRRQEADQNATDGSLILNPEQPAMTFEEWDQTTNEACLEALSKLRQSTNPSGHCICYNLPSLDTTTGNFTADLRMYRVSEPRDGFASVQPGNVSVDVFYNGAGVKQSTQITPTGMTGTFKSISKRQNSSPELVRVFTLEGTINEANFSTDLTMAKLEELVLPVFTLTATNSTGSEVKTNVSTNEASFLTGVFSNQVVLSDFATAQAAVRLQTEALANGTVAFVLPGVQLMIFPVGLIITSIWMVVGVAVYAFGTMERMNYAHMYKARKAAVGKKNGTI